jgi:ERCC4-related helicase
MVDAIKSKIINDPTGKSKLLLLSYTPIEKKSDEKVLFYLLDYIINPDAKLVPRFYRKLKKYFGIKKNMINSCHIHDYLSKSPEKALVKMNISSYFKENKFEIRNIIKNIYNNATDGDFEKINSLSQKYNDLNKKLKINEDYSLIKLMQKTLQEIEKIKSNYIVMKVLEILEKNENNHVIVFVNYRNTLYYIYDKLKTYKPAKLYGDPKNNNRQEAKRFNMTEGDKKTRLIISTIGSGATGINLHDKKGNKPRYVFISPSSSSATLIQQSLGRAFRVGTKSDVHQYFVFTKNNKYQNENYESMLAKTVSRKLEYIKQLRDNPGQHLNGEYKYIDDIDL